MILFELFYTFFLIGLFTFGGGYAMIPMIQEQVVNKGWISETALTDFIAISEATPGPFAINIATFVGNSVGNVGGALLATLGVILPSLIIIIIIAAILKRFIKNRFVQGALKYVKPVVLSLILSTAITICLKVTMFQNGSLQSSINIDKKSIILLVMMIGFMLIYKQVKKKSLSPLKILGICGLLGIIIFI